ncbi:energy transducer TonB [Haliovirga abyssi]|uniref:TonB C-terminal domain-containing protein n=1 Tax=Haliovirga abyssi TaxID=2996794 RepID=A0AAU9DEZ6_9FUSO|nr:energy transducer TonB [Haliovirga abyssi]BDU50972.1 hypothetical protein HLVA_15410 [Haliovirga abyssi]
MEKNDNKIFIFAIVISILIHNLLFLIPINFKTNYEEKIVERKKIKANFVKLYSTKTKAVKTKKAKVRKKIKVKKQGKKLKKKITKPKVVEFKKIDYKNLIEKIDVPVKKNRNLGKIIDIPINKTTKNPSIEHISKIENIKAEKKEELKILEPNLDIQNSKIEEFTPKIKDESIITENEVIPVKGEIQEGGLSSTEIPQGITIDEVVDGVGKAEILKYVKPKYPLVAEKNGWEGKVTLILNVSAEGRVKEIRIKKKSSYTILDKSAVDAGKNWRLIIQDKGVKLSGSVIVTINFRLIKGR